MALVWLKPECSLSHQMSAIFVNVRDSSAGMKFYTYHL